MGAEALETVSADRIKYIAYFHRLKYEADQESQLIYATRRGEEKGIKIGEEKGIKIGEEKGRKEGASSVLVLMRQGYTAEEIEKIISESKSVKEERVSPAEVITGDGVTNILPEAYACESPED